MQRLFCRTEFWYLVVLVRWHDDVLVVVVALNAGCYRLIGVIDNLSAFFVQKILHGLDIVHI
jgi:hypothetical protein